ncbi:MAG: hypothetical protein M3328_10310 [Chloroflexota bacterium]|nr:hypothetical protein [Chloroflexota bacterium]
MAVGTAVSVGVFVGTEVLVGVLVGVLVLVLVLVGVEIGATTQGFNVEVELRALGVVAVKSFSLLSVSVQPPAARTSAVVTLGAGPRPPPSQQLAVVPYPMKSIVEVSERMLLQLAELEIAVVLLRRATLPAVPDMAIVPVASVVGN